MSSIFWHGDFTHTALPFMHTHAHTDTRTHTVLGEQLSKTTPCHSTRFIGDDGNGNVSADYQGTLLSCVSMVQNSFDNVNHEIKINLVIGP